MSSYEDHIVKILLKEKIDFTREKTFKDLRKGRYRFDFYIPDYKSQTILIECDGEQHFKPAFSKLKKNRNLDLRGRQERDRLKNSFCLAKGLSLYRIPYWEIENIKSFKDIIVPKFLVTSKWHNDRLEAP